jgi:ribosomal protein S18 acetylase RimI-like enzyme
MHSSPILAVKEKGGRARDRGSRRRAAVNATIEALAAPDVARDRAALSALLVDAVDSGASIGFLPPLGEGAALRDGSCLLLVARPPEGGVVGSVQLDLALRANARHRAEVMRLIIHRRARRQGLGRALMLAIEEHARRRGRTTLVLDTRHGDPSERLYQSLGWALAGTIPRYTPSARGTLDATAIYYRLLGPA